MTETTYSTICLEKAAKFSDCPRFNTQVLIEDDILRIAKLAVILAKEENERELGRLTKKGFFWLLGSIATATFTWFLANGFIKIG